MPRLRASATWLHMAPILFVSTLPIPVVRIPVPSLMTMRFIVKALWLVGFRRLRSSCEEKKAAGEDRLQPKIVKPEWVAAAIKPLTSPSLLRRASR